jgi:hypothetical protein
MNRDKLNYVEQQQTFDAIMQSVLSFNASDWDSLNSHEFHFISGPGGTGKSALFQKLQAACQAEGIPISICAAITLAALLVQGATSVHVCLVILLKNRRILTTKFWHSVTFLKSKVPCYMVLVLFWDEIVSNDCSLFETVLQAMETKWKKLWYNVFICDGDFAQVCSLLSNNHWQLCCLSSHPLDTSDCQREWKALL